MEKTGGSRLLQMQARFQQRQVAEKEHRLVARYEAQQARTLTRLTASSESAAVEEAPHRQGKVRQMFEERRSKAGIDKSYPLQPIHSNGDKTTRRPLPNGLNKLAKRTEKKATKPSLNNGVRHQKGDSVTNAGGDINHNTTRQVHQAVTKNNNHFSEARARAPPRDRPDGALAANIEDETFPHHLAPPPTASPPPRPALNNSLGERKAPLVSRAPARPRVAASHASTPAVTTKHGGADTDVRQESPRLEASSRSTGPPPPRPGMNRTANPDTSAVPTSPSKTRPGAARPATASASAADAGTPCTVCGRRFAPDRLAKHEDICKKANAKKRKPYDALKHRLAGTEAEPFIRQIKKLPAPGKSTSSTKQAKSGKQLNSTWRQKHEDFIRSIRAAKQAQAHVAAGGKLSDLPPPPPSENPDYVQCPHCQRKFNQQAAERHIPKCSEYIFNKPKAPARKR